MINKLKVISIAICYMAFALWSGIQCAEFIDSSEFNDNKNIYYSNSSQEHNNIDEFFEKYAGKVISLKCTAYYKENNHQYLDVNTHDGSHLYLSPRNDENYTGTHWKVEATGRNKYSFRCLGRYHNKDRQYLDASTIDGSVYLSPKTGGCYTGTHWKVESRGNKYSFKCLGSYQNDDHQYLYGNVNTGKVVLAPNSQSEETLWTISILE